MGIGKVNIITFLPARLEGDLLLTRLGEDLFSFLAELLVCTGGERPKIMFNFSGVTYAKPAFGKFKRFTNVFAATGGKIVMCCVGEDIFESLDLHGLAKVFGIEKDRDLVTSLELFQD